jgi:hypothetical protein
MGRFVGHPALVSCLKGSRGAPFGLQENIFLLLTDNVRKEVPMKPRPQSDRKITIEGEEYDVLLSELPPSEAEPKPTDDFPELDEKLKKIEL